ncbi:MAG: type II secretion system secretin GspD [Gammaproteobacteria bacterium]|nr:type II secretion system secretin GspD [Gammaproteobacteria bacterium]MCK5262985.1 type II secretion system secretin GspD [Gammaproteobacteria bacterium]
MISLKTKPARQQKTRIACSFIFLLFFSFSSLANEITLNLKDADIRALISTVSKFTGKNFIIDPRIKAKVTVVSANTMSQDEVYEVFLSVLQVHGFAAVTTGSVIKIIPVVNAKQGTVPLTIGNNNPLGDALITKVVRMDHVPAAQLVPILRPLVPQQGHLAAYAPTNSLIITDHSGNIQRLMKIIAGVDRPESDELEVIQLKHASAKELVRIVNSLYQKTGGAKNEAKKINMAADERTNSILMTGEPSARLKARTTILQLDTPLEDGGNTHVIYLKYANAENLVKILTGIQSSVAKPSSVRGPAAKTAAARSTSSAFSQKADIQADDDTNALIITADPNTLKSLKSVIRQLDIRRAQVLIEAIIAEITAGKSREVGVGMAVDGSESSSDNVPFTLSNFGGLGGILAAAGGNTTDLSTILTPALTLGVAGTNSSGVRYALLLRALATNDASNILSTPSIVTLDNEEAEIIVGQNVPFVTGSFTNAGSSDPSNPFQTIERQDVGLTLKVTPQVNEGDTIKLDLEQKTDSVIPGTEVTGITTRKRSIKTSVLVDDGGILVLGGLMEETMSEGESKVPLLGDIPLLGALFRSTTSNKSKQNLMVFLRPSILRDDTDAAYITNEKYNFLRSQQLQFEDEPLEQLDDSTPTLDPLTPKTLDKAQVKNKKKEVIENGNDLDDDWDDNDEYI